MRPFLLLSTRPEDEAVAGERQAVLQFTGLADDELHQWRLEARPMPAVRLGDYSGIILGGGPFNSSDTHKSPLQRRVEHDLSRLLADVLAKDFPFLGLCYGVGTVTGHLGGVVDRTYGEPVGSVEVRLSPAGRRDPVLSEVPDTFEALVGHKEAVTVLPAGVEELAHGRACPIQMYRVGSNCYVTQFHPELDAAHMETRIRVYQHHGYFEPDEMDALIRRVHDTAPHPAVHSILRRFVELHGTGDRTRPSAPGGSR